MCNLRSLEILDLGRNKLRMLPPDIVKLSSLKVFALQKNQISELPLCLADMPSLQMLKLDGNPIRFPPPEILQIQASSPPNEGFLMESEVTEVTVTAHIKKILRQKAAAMNGRAEVDLSVEESHEGMETPRPPPAQIKRVISGRFPIKVNGTDVPDMRSPNIAVARPPPIPSRSHYRGLSQQATATRRPGVMPLTIGSVNERTRSNSETVLQSGKGERSERSESRFRRMGIVSRKPSELGTLDEGQANNRFSHYRGLSHGSAMQGNGAGGSVNSPASPADPGFQRPVYVRRLSILPEKRPESKMLDPLLEAAKGILYSIFQLHPMIQMLLSLTNDGTNKRSSLEIVFYNTNAHVEELELELQKYDPVDEDVAIRENENVHRACLTLVHAYSHVCSLLASNVDLFIDTGDPRYIRTLLTQLYNSIMELRVSCAQLAPDDGHRRAATRASLGGTLLPRSRENSATPTVERPGFGRGRSGNTVYNPINLRVATDVPGAMPYVNGTSRTLTFTSATPRSGESFVSTSTGRAMGDFPDEDRIFEKIFLSLQRSTELVMRTLPSLLAQLNGALRNAQAQRREEHILQSWRLLIVKCTHSIQQSEMLKNKLSSIKLKEPGIRTQSSFWTLCNGFIDAWYELINKMKDFVKVVQIPMDTRPRLRPIQQSMKETWDLMCTSPWSYHTRQLTLHDSGILSPYGAGAATPVPMPMTPQSAALGPAVQATVPSTPQSASFASAFNGNVFERADALISMGGISMSRHGTMNSGSMSSSVSSLSSLNSTLSSHHGDVAPIMSPNPGPGPFGLLPLRQHHGSKVGGF